MNREIKFRAYNHNTKEMRVSPSEIQHLGSWFEAHLPGALADLSNITIMQFIGLMDRGRYRIYEGDILENPKGEKGLVVFNEAGFYLKCIRKNGSEIFIQMTERFVANKKVIGNKYENPELLESEVQNV